MKRKKFQWRKFISLVLTVVMLSQNCLMTSADDIAAPEATEQTTEAVAPVEAEPQTEAKTEAPAPVSETEATEADTTEAATTEAQTEAVTEAATTEAQTEAVTEAAATEAQTEAVTEAAATEAQTEAPATEEQTTETTTEAPQTEATEAVTEATESETQTESETEAMEYKVTFKVDEGATVSVDGVDVTNQAVAAKDGKVAFAVTAAEGYIVTKVVAKNSSKNDPLDPKGDGSEYALEGIAEDTLIRVRVEEEDAKTEFKYEDDTIIVKATVPEEAKLSEDVELAVEPMEIGSSQFEKAVAAVEEVNGSSEDVIQLIDYAGWKVHFELDGDKVEPEAEEGIEFSVQYKDAAFANSNVAVESYTTFQLNSGLNSAKEVDESVSAKGEFVSSESDYGIMVMSPHKLYVTKGTTYHYEDYGYGTYLTSEYHVHDKTNGKEFDTICVVPSRAGTSGTNWLGIKTVSNKAIVRLAHWAYHPDDLKENYAAAAGWSRGRIFVLCHIAAAKEYYQQGYGGNSDYFHGTNQAGKDAANALLSFAKKDQNLTLTKTNSAGIKYEGDKWVEYSDTFTITKTNTVVPLTIEVPSGVSVYEGSTLKGTTGGKYTITSGKAFKFRKDLGDAASSFSTTVTIKTSPTGSISVVEGAGYYQDFAESVSGPGYKSVKIDVNWSNKKLDFIKKGENGVSLVNTELEIVEVIDNKEGAVVDSWKISDNATHSIGLNTETGKKLKPGTYKLKEVNPAPGYTKANAKSFTITSNGSINTNGTVKLEMQNELIHVKVDKRGDDGSNLNNRTDLEITITGIINGDEQTMKVMPGREIGGLKIGETYMLEEKHATKDFTRITNTVSFKVEENGEITGLSDANAALTTSGNTFIITLTDKKIDAKMVKRSVDALTDTTNLEGAVYTVYKVLNPEDPNSKEEVGTVTSAGTPQPITGLEVGETYRMYETAAPKGYTIMGKDSYVEFKLTDDGKFDVDSVKVVGEIKDFVGVDSEKNELILRDKLTEVDITKSKLKDALNVSEGKDKLSGATLQILDAYGNIAKDNSGKSLEWVTDDKAYIVKGLSVDTKYTLHEVNAPDGYMLAEDIDFQIDKYGTVSITNNKGTLTGKTIDMLDELTLMKFKKVSHDVTERNDEVHISIVDENDKVVTLTNERYPKGQELSWTVKMNVDEVEVYGLKPGSYKLVEEIAPSGFAKNEQPFTVTANQPYEEYSSKTIRVETLTNYQTRVQIGKIFEEEHDGLMTGDEKIVFQLTGEGKYYNEKIDETIEITSRYPEEDPVIEIDGKPYTEYLSDVIYGLPVGKYTLTETAAPDGYSWADPYEFEVTEEMNGLIGSQMDAKLVEVGPIMNETNKVGFIKVNAQGEAVKDVHLQVLDENNEVAKTVFGEELDWMTDGTTNWKVFKGLAEGSYKLHEAEQPAEYVGSLDVEFKVEDNGTVTTADGEEVEGITYVRMVNEKTKLIITKNFEDGYNMKDGEAVVFSLEGPKNEAGELAKDAIKEEVRLVKDHLTAELEGLHAGYYTLTELSAPAGFNLAAPVTFEVTDKRDDSGKIVVAEVTVDDFANRTQFDKVDEQGRRLAGAHLQVVDANGNVAVTKYDEKLDWTTDGTVREFKGLPAGKYTLREVTPPVGYLTAAEIPFEVQADQPVSAEALIVRMVDDVAGSIQVQKIVVDEATGEYAPTNYTFYTALFADAAMTQRVTDVKPLTVSGTYTTSVTFDNLPMGTYYVAETNASGTPITSDPFIVRNEISNSSVTLTPQQATAASTITNYVTTTRGYYDDGEVTVNKQVLVNNEPKNVNETFYFALFQDEAKTMLVEDCGVQALVLNGESSGKVVFENVPFGEFYLAETDANGVPVGGGFAYDVTIDTDHFTLSEEQQNMTVNVTNSQEETTEEESEETSEETTKKTTTSEKETNGSLKAASVKTGDNTPIMTLLILLAASALVILFVASRRRKTNR